VLFGFGAGWSAGGKRVGFCVQRGTCLVASVRPIRRVSIDVDILCTESGERLEQVLAETCRDKPPFRGFEYQPRRAKDNPPLKYYRILCDSVADPAGQTHVQLDMMLETRYYPGLIDCPLRFPDLGVESDTILKIPSHSSLLADKLSAFAPETIGYHYQPAKGEPDPLRLVKHLFDIGVLFEQDIDLRETVETYHKVFEVQNEAKGSRFTIEQALMDSYNTAFLAATLSGGAGAGKAEARKSGYSFENYQGKQVYLDAGRDSLKSHLTGVPYSQPQNALASAKAAVVAASLVRRRTDLNLGTIFSQANGSLPGVSNGYFSGARRSLNRLYKITGDQPVAYNLWVLADRILNQSL